MVDGLLPWDAERAKLAPSTVLLTLVMNVLTQRNPLYRVEDWVATLPLPMLWGDAIQASQFNDDALGRVLEDLADHGQALLATLGTRMQAVEHAGPARGFCTQIRPPSPCLATTPIRRRGRRPRSRLRMATVRIIAPISDQ